MDTLSPMPSAGRGVFGAADVVGAQEFRFSRRYVQNSREMNPATPGRRAPTPGITGADLSSRQRRAMNCADVMNRNLEWLDKKDTILKAATVMADAGVGFCRSVMCGSTSSGSSPIAIWRRGRWPQQARLGNDFRRNGDDVAGAHLPGDDRRSRCRTADGRGAQSSSGDHRRQRKASRRRRPGRPGREGALAKGGGEQSGHPSGANRSVRGGSRQRRAAPQR